LPYGLETGNLVFNFSPPLHLRVMRPHWPTFFTNGEQIGAVKEFVDFTVGPEGQKIVEQVGFVPIK